MSDSTGKSGGGGGTKSPKDSATTKTAEKSADKSADKGADKSTEKSTDKSADGAASEKDSSGGTWEKNKPAGNSEVYYGHFSNVKNDTYRNAWDEIWGKGDEDTKPARKKKPAAKAKKPASPITLAFDMEDLPAELRDALAEVARAKLKKSRVNYDKFEKVGSVDWRIECHVKR